jgi:hypothetical protein
MYASFRLLASAYITSLMQQLLDTTTTTITNVNHPPLPCIERQPPMWPSSLIVVQRRIPDADSLVGPATTVTYYDSNVGGNLIQITPDNSSEPVLWDLELDTHHSFYFSPGKWQTCKAIDFPVGILRRDWLQDAEPLGEVQDEQGGTSCGWTKADFIDYYVDKETGYPTSWYFHTMKATFQVLYYKENADIDPSLFVPPDYCMQH